MYGGGVLAPYQRRPHTRGAFNVHTVDLMLMVALMLMLIASSQARLCVGFQPKLRKSEIRRVSSQPELRVSSQPDLCESQV